MLSLAASTMGVSLNCLHGVCTRIPPDSRKHVDLEAGLCGHSSDGKKKAIVVLCSISFSGCLADSGGFVPDFLESTSAILVIKDLLVVRLVAAQPREALENMAFVIRVPLIT